jgi:putative tricarboxylic transport membrane protein
MEDLLANLGTGFGVALTPTNLLFAFAGALVGTLIGVLPGVGPIATISLLLPLTYHFPPVSALIMLAGIYYGAQYGGSTTAILINLPGESASVVTCLDGYQMARRGRAGAALAIAALASLFAGCLATLILAAAAPPLTEVALLFGSAEYFSLMVLGLVAAIVLSEGSVPQALAMITFGLILGMVGTDTTSGLQRLTFGVLELSDGISFVPLAMGLFAIPEIIRNIVQPEERKVADVALGKLWPNREEFKLAWPSTLRGTGLGAVLGILPGGGATLSSFASYAIEKRMSRTPARFGQGAIEGVAGPEAANNAGAQTSFIPLLTLGIPANAVMALMAGALTIHGIRPGPNVMTEQPDLFWGLIASMWIGNFMLVVINLPLISIWIRLLRVPYRWLYPIILVFCCIGVYSVNNSTFEVLLLVAFGALGVLLYRLRCEPAPLLLAFVLGPMMEDNFRRAMLLSRGDPTTFVTRPLSLGLLLGTLALLVLVLIPAFKKRRDEAFGH